MSLFWLCVIVYVVGVIALASFAYYDDMDPIAATACGLVWPVVVLATLIVLPGGLARRIKKKRGLR
jgi:ABC-type transport system involved in cytochrome c biogenesis permease component